jgi:hypothetical protein
MILFTNVNVSAFMNVVMNRTSSNLERHMEDLTEHAGFHVRDAAYIIYDESTFLE